MTSLTASNTKDANAAKKLGRGVKATKPAAWPGAWPLPEGDGGAEAPAPPPLLLASEADQSRAYHLFEAAAQQNDPAGMVGLAECHM